MRKYILFTLFLLSLCTNATLVPRVKYITLNVGETKEFINFRSTTICYISDPTIIEFLESQIDPYDGTIYWVTNRFKGVKAGTTVIAATGGTSNAVNFGNWKTSDAQEYFLPADYYVITVMDVTSISIPSNISLTTGESFIYSPIITDKEANTTLNWTSSNSSVATVGNDGSIEAVGAGTATITCTATNGVKAQSIVTVSPQLISKVTLSKKNQEMNIGDKTLLTTTITPNTATSNEVNWLSTNDNIAQVDDEGNVTAIGPGYCSIIAIADDGSGKFAKCLVHVQGTAGVRGDMNDDGKVTVTDAAAVIDIILSTP